MIAAPEFGDVAERLLRQACVDLDGSLRRGRSDRAERLLAAYPMLAAQSQSAVELIYTEFAAREELGQRPAPEEYYLRFPHWREALRRQFSIHDWMRGGLQEELPASSSRSADEPDGPTSDAPRWLGTYELIEEVGRGGCGAVYRAWQHGLERAVAIKFLPPGAASGDGRARLLREARVMARLQHPNIMPVYEVAENGGVVYFSMPLAPRGALSGRTGTATTIVGWMEAAARAVHHAHQNGVVHCDLKPSNILLDANDRPLVSDFGLAQEPDGSVEPGDDALVLIGSPAYMAPEQITARPGACAPPLDVWALGVLLYELVAGERPFVGDTLPSLRQRICHDEPAPLGQRAAGVSALLEAVCARCLAKDPARRYNSAADLADDLAACRP
jgi:serine/threonine protein kinase